jgi:hypothetical protein
MTLLWRSERATKRRCSWWRALQSESAAARATPPTTGRSKTACPRAGTQRTLRPPPAVAVRHQASGCLVSPVRKQVPCCF